VRQFGNGSETLKLKCKSKKQLTGLKLSEVHLLLMFLSIYVAYSPSQSHETVSLTNKLNKKKPQKATFQTLLDLTTRTLEGGIFPT
jgi:hypothetical protein